MKSNGYIAGHALEYSSSSKTSQISEKNKSTIQNIKNEIYLSLKMKILLFILIGIIIIITGALIGLAILYSNSTKKYKMEISDLEIEKSVLEFQKSKLNKSIINLETKKINLNQTNVNLNYKLAKVSNDEMMINKTYKTVEKISNEGQSLKNTFSALTKSIDKINIKEQYGLAQLNNNRELEENINSIKDELELIKALMEQININLDLANKNKELLLNNINLTNALNQQIINIIKEVL